MYINPIVLPDSKIVLAQPDYYKMFLQSNGKTITVNDMELIERDGKKYANIKDLNLDIREVEIPGDIAEMRAQKRQEAALEKGAIHIDRSVNPVRYFYLIGDSLRVLQGEKEIIADKIEIVHGRKAVNVESLDLGHPYLELPGEVEKAFSKVMKEAELRTLALIPVGTSLLNGLDYYGFNINVPESVLKQVKACCEFFDTEEGDIQGWLTCDPVRVSEILKIPIEGRV